VGTLTNECGLRVIYPAVEEIEYDGPLDLRRKRR
jgi:hypothetical protein